MHPFHHCALPVLLRGRLSLRVLFPAAIAPPRARGRGGPHVAFGIAVATRENDGDRVSGACRDRERHPRSPRVTLIVRAHRGEGRRGACRAREGTAGKSDDHARRAARAPEKGAAMQQIARRERTGEGDTVGRPPDAKNRARPKNTARDGASTRTCITHTSSSMERRGGRGASPPTARRA